VKNIKGRMKLKCEKRIMWEQRMNKIKITTRNKLRETYAFCHLSLWCGEVRGGKLKGGDPPFSFLIIPWPEIAIALLPAELEKMRWGFANSRGVCAV
jgi:hypothetical protein